MDIIFLHKIKWFPEINRVFIHFQTYAFHWLYLENNYQQLFLQKYDLRLLGTGEMNMWIVQNDVVVSKFDVLMASQELCPSPSTPFLNSKRPMERE